MKGLTLAKSLYRDSLLNNWVNQRRNRFATQLEYVDTISHRYMYVMNALPKMLGGIMYHVLHSYARGIQPKEVARRMFQPQQSISSGFKRLREAGIVHCRQGVNKREKVYFVADWDFLLVNAVRWDSRFVKFLEKNRHRMADNLVDEFIALH